MLAGHLRQALKGQKAFRPDGVGVWGSSSVLVVQGRVEDLLGAYLLCLPGFFSRAQN